MQEVGDFLMQYKSRSDINAIFKYNKKASPFLCLRIG